MCEAAEARSLELGFKRYLLLGANHGKQYDKPRTRITKFDTTHVAENQYSIGVSEVKSSSRNGRDVRLKSFCTSQKLEVLRRARNLLVDDSRSEASSLRTTNGATTRKSTSNE